MLKPRIWEDLDIGEAALAWISAKSLFQTLHRHCGGGSADLQGFPASLKVQLASQITSSSSIPLQTSSLPHTFAMYFFVVMLACLAGASNAATGKLPEYFPALCARNDPQLSQCIKANLQQLLPRLVKGDRDLELDVLDPITINEVRLDLNREPFVMSAAVRNSRTYGVAGLQVQDVRVKRINNDNLDMEIDVIIPKMLVEGDFKLDGHIGSFPTNGKGFFNISLAGIHGTWKISGSAVELSGERYMQIKTFFLDYTLAEMKVFATNLVDGAPDLSALALQLINQFWPSVFRAVDPFTREPFSRVLTRLANKVFLRVPYDQLFPVA